MFKNCRLTFAYMWYTQFVLCDIVDSEWGDSYHGGNVAVWGCDGMFTNNHRANNSITIPPRQWHNYPLQYIVVKGSASQPSLERVYCQCIIAQSIDEFRDLMEVGEWWPTERLNEMCIDFQQFKRRAMSNESVNVEITSSTQ